eukprot:tig00020614_g12171.t1
MAAIAPAKKTLVFIPSKQEGYVLADIVSQNEREVRIRPRDKGDQQERLVPVTDILPSNPESAAPPDDNTALMHLHAASLLHNLRVRYDKDQIYTYTAYILLAVNPYKTLPIYDDSLMERYRGKSIGKEVPHVFAVTDRAYRLMKAEGINQSIVISGESGAGKTETSKYAMRFLAHVGKASAKGELGERVLDTNPILEAFGNAKTLRNNNSSRFGKYIKINFNKDGSVVGASIVTYLLERSRVTQQDKDERNYHIFYQLCAGANDEERKSLKLGKADQYHMLRQSGCIRIEGVDDAEEFQRVKGAMDRIGIGAGERTDAFRVLAGLLHLSNVTFKEGDKDDCQVENPDELQVAAELFKIDFESFKKTLITRTMETRGQVFEIPLKHFEAVNARNALAKAVYQRLFDWLVARINKGLQEIEASHQYIGILDIFGFEFFQRNSFEQLCINYANEKLQQYFNQQIFKQEQDIYERDGIKFERVKFVDNTDTIDMIEKRPGGILHILEEENRMPNGSDKSFCLKVHEAFKGHSRLAAPAVASRKETGYLTKDEGFLVNHFAGEVTYDVANFLEKNNDTVHGDLLAMFQRSKDPFLQHLFPEQPPPPKFGPKERSTRFSSVGGKFSVQLQELMKDLGQTSSHFIRCIKPNALQRAGNFAGAAVLEQLRASGMLEALRLLHAGYPTRCAFDALYKRYGPFMPEAIRRLDAPHFCEAFLMALEFKETDFQIGLTKVFFRSGKLAELDEVIGTEDQKVPDHIIAKVKKWLVKKRWRRLIGYRKACVRVVRRLRALRALRLFMRMAGVAVVYRRSLWRLLQRVRRTIAARNIQAAFRCARLRFQFVRRRRAAVCIQSHWKGHKTYQLMKPVLTERREARLAELAAQVKAERERQERERREQAERYRKQVMENLRRKEDAAAERKRQEQRTRTEYTKTTEQHVEETVTVTEPMPMTQELFNVVTDMVKQLSKTVADLQEEVRQLREERVAPAERGLAATASKVEAMETHAAEEKMRLDGELAAVRASAAERAERVDAKIADVEEEARRIESESRSAHDQLWHAMGQRAEKAELERSVQSLHGELSAVANKAAEAASSKSDAVKSEMTALNEKIRAEAAAAEKRLAEELDRRVEEAAKKADAAEAGLRSALEAAQAALAKQITDVQEKSIAELRKQLEATEASLGEVKVSAGRAEGAGGEAAAAAEERLGARLAAAEEAAARAESGLRDAVADAMESARAMLQAVSSKQEEALREAEARLQAAVAERAEQAREALSDTERRVADIAAEQEKGLEAVAATASAAERRAGELEQQLREALAEGQSRALAEASAAAAAAQQRVAEVERQLREAMAEQQRAAEGAVAAAAKEAKEAAAAVERQLREALAEQQRAAAAEAAAAGEKGRAAEGALGALEKRLAELKDTQERQRASAVAAEAAVAELRAELHKERARLADMERAVDSARQETSQTREVSLGQQSAALAEAEGRLQAAIAERGAATAALEQRLAESERALREALAAEAKRHEALQEALGRQEKAAAGALEEQRKALEARLAAFAAEQASASASTAAALDKRLASAAEEQQRAAAAAARAGEGLASQLREELRRQEGAVEELKQRVAQLLQASVADEGRASAASEKFEAVEEALKSEMAELRETIARTSTGALAISPFAAASASASARSPPPSPLATPRSQQGKGKARDSTGDGLGPAGSTRLSLRRVGRTSSSDAPVPSDGSGDEWDGRFRAGTGRRKTGRGSVARRVSGADLEDLEIDDEEDVLVAPRKSRLSAGLEAAVSTVKTVAVTGLSFALAGAVGIAATSELHGAGSVGDSVAARNSGGRSGATERTPYGRRRRRLRQPSPLPLPLPSLLAKEEVAAAREQLKEDVFAAVLDNHEATVKKDIEALKAQMLKVAEAAKAAKTAEAAKAGEAERRVADMEKAVGDAVKRFSDSSADLRKDFRGDLTEGMAKLKEELEGRLREVQEAAGRAANAGENERRLAQLEDSYQRAIDENQNLRHQLGIARHDDLESSAKLDHLSSSLNTTAYNSTVAINRYQNVVVEQEKLRKELAKERESNEARVAGLVEEISRSNEKIKSFERTAALFEAEKLRNEKLLQETLKRVEEIEKRHELEGTPAKTVRSASVRGIPVPAPSVSMGSVEMEPMGGESGSPPRQLTLLPSPPEDPVTPTPSKRAIEAEPEEMSMTPQRCNEALAPLMKQRGGQVKALADAVSRFVGAIAQPTSIRGSFTQRELPKAENDMLRPELRHLVSSLIDIFGQKAKKRGGMLGFGGEALHAWDVFETFAQNHPMRDQTNPLPTYLVGMVETHVRSVLSNADFIKRSSARDVKDARFHALVRAALNNKTLHAALRELFENMFPTLTPLYEDDAPVLHPSLQHDVVLAVEPLARIPFAYYLDLFNPVLASERDIRASTAR